MLSINTLSPFIIKWWVLIVRLSQYQQLILIMMLTWNCWYWLNLTINTHPLLCFFVFWTENIYIINLSFPFQINPVGWDLWRIYSRRRSFFRARVATTRPQSSGVVEVRTRRKIGRTCHRGRLRRQQHPRQIHTR